MTAKLGSLAAQLAVALGTPLDPRALTEIAAWLARLEEWNARMDLTAARTQEELVELMLADALVLAPHLPRGSALVDIGTGAGAPGLALALIRPDLRVTLVEPLGKRASFLRTVIGVTGRTDVSIERARANALVGRTWDVAVSRATLPPPEWLELGARLVASGGTVWVMVAEDDAPSCARTVREGDLRYTLPLTGARRRALSYRTG